MITWQEWGYIIGGYLSGSVLYSYLLPKALKGIDITAESPDGNPGTANAFTCVGIPIGILVLCMELLKGYLPVHLALRRVDPARWRLQTLILPVVNSTSVSHISYFKNSIYFSFCQPSFYNSSPSANSNVLFTPCTVTPGYR